MAEKRTFRLSSVRTVDKCILTHDKLEIRGARWQRERRKTLEEVVRLLESARTGPNPDHDFDDGRVDSYVVAALSAARSALNVASGRAESAG